VFAGKTICGGVRGKIQHSGLSCALTVGNN